MKINVEIVNTAWHDWNEVFDLIEDMESMARDSLQDSPDLLKLFWYVTQKDECTIRLQVKIGPSLVTENFEVTLCCKDLEAGTVVTLNWEEISHSIYKGRISAALVDILRRGVLLRASATV